MLSMSLFTDTFTLLNIIGSVRCYIEGQGLTLLWLASAYLSIDKPNFQVQAQE